LDSEQFMILRDLEDTLIDMVSWIFLKTKSWFYATVCALI
jgi:hypothetical protein